MTNEEKQILLKDLCMRLPYGVKVKSSRRREPVTLSLDVITDFYLGCSVKPYLRPISSMTDKEVKDLIKVKILSKHGKVGNYFGFDNIKSIKNIHFSSRYSEWFCDVTFNTIEGKCTTCFSVGRVTWETTIAEIDWFNAHHFDYRGLIDKGLALEAPDGMYD